jgi:hypothetical protein
MEVAVAEAPQSTSAPAQALTIAVCCLIFVVTASLRFLATVSFSNDEYISLAGARQILFGEWPTRDFLDVGQPLAFAAAAAAQRIVGQNLFAEAVFTSGAFALAAVLTVVAVRRLSGSLIAGVVAALIEVAFFPRGYAYPKMLLYAAAPLVMWWYQRHPSWARMACLAAFVQIAFLFRHDHGLYIGIAATVAVVIGRGLQWEKSDVLLRLGKFALLLLLMAVPYLMYVEANEGLGHYASQELESRAAELETNQLTVPPFGSGVTLEKNCEAFLFFLFYLLPVVAAVVLVVSIRNGGSRVLVAQIAAIIVLAVIVDRGFLRDELWTRLVDAFVPAALLFGWLWGQTGRVLSTGRRWSFRALALVVGCLSAIAATQIGRTAEQLNRAGLYGGLRRLPERFAERSEQLHDPYNEHQMPSRAALALIPFFKYVDRCTYPEQRLLLPGMIPELAVHAARPFAGGRLQILARFNDGPEDRRQIQARLDKQNVPFVLVTPNDREAVWAAYPELAAFVRDNYRPLDAFTGPDDSQPAVYVFVSRTLQPRSVDAATGWPCFR